LLAGQPFAQSLAQPRLPIIDHDCVGDFVVPALSPVVDQNPKKADAQREKRNVIAQETLYGGDKSNWAAVGPKHAKPQQGLPKRFVYQQPKRDDIDCEYDGAAQYGNYPSEN